MANIGANPISGQPLWPTDWQTGWVTWLHIDMTGAPIQGVETLRMNVQRSSSVGSNTTIYGGERAVTLTDGRPSGDYVVLNSAGIPCVEMPLGNDPDIQPMQNQMVAYESWSKHTMYRTVMSSHTLENPLWLSGDLSDLAEQPGVVVPKLWSVGTESEGPPVQAEVGDLVVYGDSGRLTQITEA